MIITITKCILIKWIYFIKLRCYKIFNKSISTYTGTSIKDMFNKKLDFIFRADGECQQIRGVIYDLRWVCFDGTTSYEDRIRRMKKEGFQADIIDDRAV